MPRASNASISSEIRMAPISAVIRHPAWAAKPIPAIIGAISRVFAYAETNPVSGPMPTMSRAPYPSIPTEPPTAAPMNTSTPMVPPPTISEPFPQIKSTNSTPVWCRYRFSVSGIAPSTWDKKVTW